MSNDSADEREIIQYVTRPSVKQGHSTLVLGLYERCTQKDRKGRWMRPHGTYCIINAYQFKQQARDCAAMLNALNNLPPEI